MNKSNKVNLQFLNKQILFYSYCKKEYALKINIRCAPNLEMSGLFRGIGNHSTVDIIIGQSFVKNALCINVKKKFI